MLLIVASVLIPLLGIIMGIVYMTSPDLAKKSLGKIMLIIGIGIVLFYCALSGALNNMQSNF